MKNTCGILLILLCLIPGLILAQELIPENAEAMIDSLSEAREQSIQSEYGFRDINTLSYVAQKLEIADIARFKSALGLEPANKALDDMTLRRLELTPYRALLAKQTLEYGFNEISTLTEISSVLSIPIKKLKSLLGNDDPLDKTWYNRSIQALGFSPEDIQKLKSNFDEDIYLYGSSVTLVGMLVVFLALLLTSIIIRQLVHLNGSAKSPSTITISSEGKVKNAPKNLSRNVIVAAITALHIHQHEIEEQRKMVLTFRRTPTNQWRASAVLSMPNRELSSRR